MKPSIGRIVHYTSYGTPAGEYGKECRAAIITETMPDDSVGLCVLNPTGQFFNTRVAHDEGDSTADIIHLPTREHAGGTWHWPERVE